MLTSVAHAPPSLQFPNLLFLLTIHSTSNTKILPLKDRHSPQILGLKQLGILASKQDHCCSCRVHSSFGYQTDSTLIPQASKNMTETFALERAFHMSYDI